MKKSLVQQIYDKLYLTLSKDKTYTTEIVKALKKAQEADNFKNPKILHEILKTEK